MATEMISTGMKYPDGTCQRTAGRSPGGTCTCFNTCLVCCGPHTCRSHCQRVGTWTVPDCAQTVQFEMWSGGGSGAGHCCQGCWCDMASCGSMSGYYGRRTLFKQSGCFVPGCIYCWCIGAGGNGTVNNGCGCFTACCDAPRGCMTRFEGRCLCCTCMTGGRGGYNLYCSCRCNNQGNRTDGMCANGLCFCQKFDWVDLGDEPAFIKYRGNCDCVGRHTSVSASWGISNGHTYHIENCVQYCACTNCCRGFRQVSGGGSNSMKSACGGGLCYCRGTPGKPGMMRITWS